MYLVMSGQAFEDEENMSADCVSSRFFGVFMTHGDNLVARRPD
jgi:hypothetical protein